MTRARPHGVLIPLTVALGIGWLPALAAGQANRPISTDVDAPASAASPTSPTSPAQPDASATASTRSTPPTTPHRPTLPMPVERQTPAQPARPEVTAWGSADAMPDDRDPARLAGADANAGSSAAGDRGGMLVEALSTLPAHPAANPTPATSSTPPTTPTSSTAPDEAPLEADVIPGAQAEAATRSPAQAASPDAADAPAQATLPDNALADDDATPLFQRGLSPDGQRRTGDGESRGWGDSWILTTLSSLGVVIGLILAARWVMLRVSTGRGGGAVVSSSSSSSSSLVEVLARVNVSPRQQILLVRVVGRVLVVAESAAGMTTLTELDDADEVAAVLQAVAAKRSASVGEGFSQFLARFAGGYDGAADPTAVKDPGRAARRAEGADSSEFVQDKTRHEVSGLLSKVRRAGREFVG